MENPIKMDDLWDPYFLETSISVDFFKRSQNFTQTARIKAASYTPNVHSQPRRMGHG